MARYRRVLSLVGLLALILALCATAPPRPAPTPTPVLVLGTPAARPSPSRRYYSALAPYSITTNWFGQPERWPDGRWDQFAHDGRIMEIEGDRAVPGATTAQAVQELLAYLRTLRVMEAHVVGPVLVAGRTCRTSSRATAATGWPVSPS